MLGDEINDHLANSIIAQLLFLAADDPDRDIQMYINSPGGARGQASDIHIHAQWILKTKEKINHVLLERTGQPLERIERDSDRDFLMDTAVALEYGLIDKIVNRT